MSNTPVQDLPARGVSSGSGQTLPSRLLQPTSDPSASKRVCFYKSGDYKFSGHRMVINGRTFKTFDALLDALSKKVPLPFGVRTITTPRGTHHVRNLDDLQDGGSYVCSDQRRIKPLNLDEVNRRQVPWNTTRPFSAGRRKRQGSQFGQFSRRSDISNRPTRVTDRVAVRTPKKLTVIKNRDPTVKRTIVLQRRTAPTFDALLDYLSQILQFPVLKLYSTDGRRVDGLAALILCSGVIVAAGTEPFRLANYTFHRTGQTVQAIYMDPVEPPMLQPHTQENTKSFSSGRGSRNFSLSSERYIVNQINKSRNGNMDMQHHNGSFETEANQRHTSIDTCGSAMADNEPLSCIAPQDDDIEKSFRVNQDGSMTVEMKVRLTIKEEEMLHWTTTLSRSSLKRTVCASISESGNTSPDSNNAIAKESSSITEDEAKEENNSCTAGRGVGFSSEGVYEGYSPSSLGNSRARFKRTPTPGPRHVKKKASVESVKTVTESGVQESTLGHYSYTERTADGETTEGYRVVRHSSSSNHRPVPKPRKTASSGASNKGSHSSMRSSGVAEVLQIQNNGMEIRETVMHIYETQGSYDNYFANEDYGADGAPSHASSSASRNRPPTDSGSQSSSNDCDIDFSSQQRQRDEMLSLSSEPVSTVPPVENNLSVVSESGGENSPIRLKDPQSGKHSHGAGGRENKEIDPPKKKGSPSTSSSEKKLKGSTVSLSKNSKRSSTDKLSSNASVGKKSQSSSESAKSGQKSKSIEKPQVKRTVRDEKKVSALLVKTPPKRQNMNKTAARDNGYNVNTPSGRPQMKKNMSDILQPKKAHFLGKVTTSKSKSVSENQISSSRKSLELSETVSMPSLNPSPSEIHQYVENWLEEVTPDAVPYNEEAAADEPQPQTKVIFQIGGDSESDEKTESQTNPEECMPSDTLKKSSSCLSVPLSHEGQVIASSQNKENSRGLCVSMPSVRVQPVPHENLLRSHKSAEAINPVAPDESTSSTSSILSPKAKIKPVLRQLCSSIQCIRTMSDTNTPGNLEKSNSLPDFSTQVASVFGSSCKAFLSFLSVMTLRDNITGTAQSDEPGSRTSSEAMLMMESLQKISTIEDEEEQRSSLTDLQSRASSQLRERWKDFQILRERLESEPLSPKFSETEFALDVVSEGGDVFDDQHAVIDELMEELNMPQDLREEISSTIQQAKSFYPVDESTFVETERYHSETEEDIEKFVRETDTDARQSPDPDSVCITDDITETKQENNGEGGDKDENISEHEPEQHTDQVEDDLDNPEGTTEREQDEAELKEEGGQIEEADGKAMNDEEDEGGDEDGGMKREEGSEEETLKGLNDEQEEAEEGSGEESVVKEEEVTDGEMTLDEEEVREGLEEDVVRETESRLTDEAEERGCSTAETDERDCEADEEDAEEEQKDHEESAEEDEEGIKAIEEAEDFEAMEEAEDEEEREEEREADEEQEEEVEEEEDGDGEKDEEREMEDMVQVRVDETEGVSNESGEGEEEEEEDDGEKLEEEEEEQIEEGEEGVQLVEEEQGEQVEGVEEEDEKEEEDKEREDEEEEGEQEQEEEEGVQLVEDQQEEEGRAQEEQTEDEGGEQEETGEVEVWSEEEEEHVEEQEEDQAKEEEGGVELEEEGEQEEDGEQEREEEDGIELEEDEGVQEEEGEQEKQEEEGVELEEEEGGQEEEEGVQLESEEEGGQAELVGEEEAESVEEVQEEEEEEAELVEEVQEEEEEEADLVEEVQEEEEEGEELAEEEEEVQEQEEEGVELDEEEEGVELDEEEEGEKEEVEEEDNDQSEEEEEGGDTAVLKTIEENTDEDVEEEEGGTDQEIEDTGRSDGDEEERMGVLTEEDSAEEKEDAKLAEESDGDDFDEPNEEGEEEDGDAGGLRKGLLGEGLRLEDEERAHSPAKYSSEGRCEDSKGEGTDATNGSEEQAEGRSASRSHPVEVSQELLDFVNSALRASSLVFTYDERGNIRIESDKVRVVPAELARVLPKSRKESSYGLRRLPSPGTSDLSDYRPETSESGGYKSQESVDIVSGSGEEQSQTPFPICRRSAHKPTKLSAASRSGVSKSSKSIGSVSRSTGAKASREDLSYFSAASSLKADSELPEGAERSVDLNGGVLIDRGRWLLKENHLIRKSPPVSLGMYGNLDSTSVDTGQENTSEEFPPHCKTHHSPLAAISSSELEEMAKPLTPKCTYYNMLHSSDSDPFLDDSSVNSGKKGMNSVQGRGFRVSPTIDTSKTWANKNGSLSSFTSVEFKVADRKVHPEGESSAHAQARRTSSGGESSLQAQDSREALRLRCGQYCPIL